MSTYINADGNAKTVAMATLIQMAWGCWLDNASIWASEVYDLIEAENGEDNPEHDFSDVDHRNPESLLMAKEEVIQNRGKRRRRRKKSKIGVYRNPNRGEIVYGRRHPRNSRKLAPKIEVVRRAA